jgi:hypothetical protein
MNDVFAEILRLKQEGQRGALCTVISSKGSLPMSGKAKMLVGEMAPWSAPWAAAAWKPTSGPKLNVW